MSGTVKWFDSKKGFGFIEPKDGSEDVFVHYSDLEGKGYRNLEQGQAVEFQVAEGKRGPKAVRVKALAAV